MFTVPVILAAALVYFAVLCLTLLFFAGASRVNERWDRTNRADLAQIHTKSRVEDIRRAA